MTQRFETFTVLINRISRNIRKIKNQEMAEYDLRSSHISCLYYLYSDGGLTATDLCERCEEDQATISRALDYTGLSDALLLKYIEDSKNIWECGLDNVRYTTIGSVIGTHAGPGAVAVAFFKN